MSSRAVVGVTAIDNILDQPVANADHLIPVFRNKYDSLAITSTTCAALLLIPLLPVEAFYSNRQHSHREANYTSDSCRALAIVAVTLCSAQLLSMLLDFRNNVNRAHYFKLRIACSFTLAVYAILYIAPKDYAGWIHIQDVIGKFQVFTELSIVLWVLNNVDTTSVWTKKRILVLLLTFFLALLFDYVHDAASVASTLSSALLFISVGMLIWGILISLYLARNDIFTSFNMNMHIALPAIPRAINTSFSLFIICTVLFGVVFELLSIVVISGVHNMSFLDVCDSSYYRACSIFNRAAVSYLLTVLPNRLYRIEDTLEVVAVVKSAFVSYISHELRNPMQVLVGGLELLQLQHAAKDTARATANTRELICASTDVQELLDNMLLYERIDRGTLTVAMVLTPMIDFLSRTFLDMQKNMDVLSLIDLLPNFDVDIVDFKSVLINIDHALLASLFRQMHSRASRGSIASDRVVISLSVLSPGTRVNADEGVPLLGSQQPRRLNGRVESQRQEYIRISMSVVRRLSTEESKHFFTSKVDFMREAHENGEGGFKLSAWILSQVAKLHGGQARGADSDPGILHLDLPFTRYHCSSANEARMLAELQAARLSLLRVVSPVVSRSRRISFELPGGTLAPTISQSSENGPNFIPIPTHTLKVLVVDDAKSCRKVLLRIMELYGYTCIEAENGKIAEELVLASMRSGEPFDLVLLDNEMPIMKGVESARVMRAHGFKGTILGVTGNVLKGDIDEFLESGVNEVILKPLTTLKFNNAMERITIASASSFAI